MSTTHMSADHARLAEMDYFSADRPPLLRFMLVRNFVLYNPLFVLSAVLVLSGAWLLNPPSSEGGRSLLLLFKLIGIVQLYELTLLGAGALLARHGRLERDVRILMLILAPFLLDVTFTTSSLVVSLLNQVGVLPAAGLAVGIVAFAALKGKIAARLNGRSFTGLEWTALLAGPALVTLYPLAGAWMAMQGFGAELGFTGGALIGALALVYGLAAQRNPDGVIRKLAPIALIAATAHVSGTVWTYGGELLHVVGPAVIALGAALPILAWPCAADRDRVTPLALPAIGAVICGLAPAFPFGLSAWHLGLAGFAAVQGVMFHRHRSLFSLAAILVAGHFVWGGLSLAESLAAVGTNAVEPIALLALFGYGLYRRAHPFALTVCLLGSAILTARLGLMGSALDGVLLLDVIGLGVLLWSHRLFGQGPEGARERFAGVFLLFVPATALGLADGAVVGDAAQWLSWVSVLALLALGVRLRVRAYALPSLILPIQGVVNLSPESSTGWGVVVLLAAFVVISAGVAISLQREKILAWLEQEPKADTGEVFALSSPNAWPGRTGPKWTVLLALIAAYVYVVAPVL